MGRSATVDGGVGEGKHDVGEVVAGAGVAEGTGLFIGSDDALLDAKAVQNILD